MKAMRESLPLAWLAWNSLHGPGLNSEKPAFAFPRLGLEVFAPVPGSEHIFIECNSGVDLLGHNVYPPVTFYTPINLLGEFHLPIFGIARL